MPVVGQGDNGGRPFALAPDQVGYAVHQGPGLARAGPRQNQDVGGGPLVGDNLPLRGVVQAIDDSVPGGRGGLAGQLVLLVGKPAVYEGVPGELEVVQGQLDGGAHGSLALLGVLAHDVNLRHLLLVVLLQGFEVAGGELGVALLQPDGHGRPEHGKALVQPDNLLVVEPQEGLLQRVVDVFGALGEIHTTLESLGELSHGGLGQQVRPPGLERKLPQQVTQDGAGGAPAALGVLLHLLPVLQ